MHRFAQPALTAGIVLLGYLTAHSGAAERLDGNYLNAWPSAPLRTPRLEFARPAAWPAPHVLFLVPTYLVARDVAELQQRLDLDVDVVSVFSDGKFGADDPYSQQVLGTTPTEKEAELTAELRTPHDAIVLGNFSLAALPAPLQAEILRQVRAGTGLLLTYRTALPADVTSELVPAPADEAANVWRHVPLELLPYFPVRWTIPPSPGQFSLRHLGQGRIALLAYPNPSPEDQAATAYGGSALAAPAPYGHQLPAAYDALLALPARALLGCTGSLPGSARIEVTAPRRLRARSARCGCLCPERFPPPCGRPSARGVRGY